MTPPAHTPSAALLTAPGVGASPPGGRARRAADPEATLRWITPLAGAMGVTRVSNLTGLDVIGLPVAAAVRPNSRSLAVHQGKGLTLTAAKISALMEAAEAFHAEFIDAPLRFGRVDELSVPTVDPHRLPLATRDVDPAQERILWIEGRDLATGGPRWVPYEVVHADFTAPQPPGSGLFQATTSGLAAGASPQQAMLHALYEAVERDAVSLWHAAGAAEGAGRAIDPADVADPPSAALLTRLAQAGVAVGLWDVTSDVGLPTVVCLVAPPGHRPDGVEPEVGYGCHHEPGVALLRAITEAVQARLTRISGARDDYAPASYDAAARAARLAEARRWLAEAERARDGWPYGTSATDAASGMGKPREDDRLADVLARLGRIGCDQVVWLDLTKPSLGIPVGRIVVPGLEGPWSDEGEYTPGRRARRLGQP